MMQSQFFLFLRRFLLTALFAIGLLPQAQLGNASYHLQASPQNPQVSHIPVLVPDGISFSVSQLPNAPAAVFENLPPLKAVVFVGPIDGENGEWTLSEIRHAEHTASVLRSFGVSVQEFYPNKSDGTWENIKNAASGAHFIMYRGHGVYWSEMPYPAVGGFALKDTFVSNEMIRSDLQPAHNFIVMLYGCFTAGSAGNDTITVSSEEARRRVEMYSDPFFDIGAGGYYADWAGDAFSSYVSSLFQGKTQQQAYESFSDYDSSKIWRTYHRNHPSFDLWLGWDNWYPPEPNWNNAFVGYPNKNIAQLFEQTSMSLSTRSIVYLSEEDFPKRVYQIQVQSTTTEKFNWEATVSSSPAWLSQVTPLQGSSGNYMSLEIDPSKDEIGGSVTVQITTTKQNIKQPTQDITVTLKIVPEVTFTYLPAVAR